MAARITLRLQQSLRHSGSWKTDSFIPVLSRTYCSSANIYNDKDPAPIFCDAKVQSVLKRLTGLSLDKIYRKRMSQKKLDLPSYEFMTDEQLQEVVAEAKSKAEKIVQMPPVMKECKEINEVLSVDPALKGHDTATFVFTDISLGISDRNRLIVTREPDGTLRRASWEVRNRMNQIYNPRPGRKLPKPKMFEEENLKDVIAREKYEFILDRVCVQFEPDDPEYQKICSLTYEAIEEKNKHEVLHSTRHYGPLCFYLAWHKKIDNLLISYVQREQLSDCVDLIQLYSYIHEDSHLAQKEIDPSQQLELIKAYIEEDSLRRPQLQLAIQQYEDLLYQRKEYEKTLEKAHGV